LAGVRLGFVWLAGIRDLQWRRRRFIIAVFGTALVFALTLLLSGFLESFALEVNRTLDTVDADGYVVQEGRQGPFTSPLPFADEAAKQVAALPGIKLADPLISILQVIDREKDPDIYLMGYRLGPNCTGGRGFPKKGHGQPICKSGDAVVDTKLGLKIGDPFSIGGHPLKVVGTVSGQTVLGGRPLVYTTIEDAQAIVFNGLPVVTSVAVLGTPQAVPKGLAYVSRDAAGRDLRRPLADVTKSIGLFRLLLWIVAGAIVGSVVYLSAIERVGDFAVFKATGTSTRDLLAALAVQAVLLSLVASIVAVGLAYLLAPQFPAEVSFPAKLVALLPVVAVIVGLLASIAGLRRAVAVDPALAFGG
jgi:putative ABC transport system permease protein